MLFGSANAYGQLEEGTIFLGSSVSNFNFSLEGQGYNINFTPKAGLFLQDNLVIGGALPIGFSGDRDESAFAVYRYSSSQLGLGIFGRYYFMNEGDVALFGGLVTSYQSVRSSSSTDYEDVNIPDSQSSGSSSYFRDSYQIGAVYFLGDNVGVDGILSFNDILGDFGASVSLSVGLQIYLQR